MSKLLSHYLSARHSFTEAETHRSLSFFNQKRLGKEEVYCAEGSICTKVAFIEKGAMRAYTTHADLQENTTCFKLEKQFVTVYESLMNQQAAKKSLQAIEATELMEITFERMQQLLEEVPAWKQVMHTIMEQDYLEKEQHLTHLNNRPAKDKYREVLAQTPEIVQRAKVEHLASYLGITTRTLSRVKREVLYTTD